MMCVLTKVWLIVVMASMICTSNVLAQQQLFNTRLPTGEIGRIQVARRPELSNVMQPVLIKVPQGANVSVADGPGFGAISSNAALVSLQVGETYRLRVGNVPHHYGDVYPSIELIDRMHAPPGKETRYPIPIEITAEEFGMAMRGKFVTRVIYVEDPRRAIGVRELPEQRYFEVMSYEDPFTVASSLGRPVAILRMGSLAPGSSGPSAGFLFGSPPVQHHAMQPTQIPYVPSPLKPSDMPVKPEKRDALPAAPTQPDPREDDETPPVPQDIPDRTEIDEEPAAEDLFDSPSDAPDTNEGDGLDGDPFGDDADPFGEGAADDDDPFGEI